jgi:hypothetical protein
VADSTQAARYLGCSRSLVARAAVAAPLAATAAVVASRCLATANAAAVAAASN